CALPICPRVRPRAVPRRPDTAGRGRARAGRRDQRRRGRRRGHVHGVARVQAPVVVVSTGGTIAMRTDPATGKLVPAVSGDELVELLAWPDAPPLELDDFAQVPSFDMHGELALALARRVGEHARRRDIDGIVVTHGTDTMEE